MDNPAYQKDPEADLDPDDGIEDDLELEKVSQLP